MHETIGVSRMRQSDVGDKEVGLHTHALGTITNNKRQPRPYVGPAPIIGDSGGFPRQFSIVRSKNSSGNLLLGVFNHSPIQNTGNPGDYLVIAKVLTDIKPLPTDTGFFAVTTFPACLYLKCTCGPETGWASNDFFTAQTIALNTASGDLPGGGMFEINYDAGPPLVVTPAFTRLLLCTAYSKDDIVESSLPQLLVKFKTITAPDSSGNNATATLFAYPGAP